MKGGSQLGLAFDFSVDCKGDGDMQCACAPTEEEHTVKAFEAAVKRGKGIRFVCAIVQRCRNLGMG